MTHRSERVRERSVMVDIARIVRVADIEMDEDLRNQIRESRADVVRLREYAYAFDRLLKDLESQDKMGNFEIQQLMSNYNQAETLAKNIAEKAACVADSIIQKIG